MEVLTSSPGLPDLKKLTGYRYRIILDESAKLDPCPTNRVWYKQIPCRYGHIYMHGENSLGAFTDRRRISSRLAKLGQIHQEGDEELSVIVDPARLDEVASLLRARKRRAVLLTETQRAEKRWLMLAINHDKKHSPKAQDVFSGVG
jgi:hypothetical protein